MIEQIGLSNAFRILEFRLKLIELRLRCSELGLKGPQQLICDAMHELSLISKSLIKYDFIKRISCGSTLLVGEGNLSFACVLAERIQYLNKMITSTYEKYSELSDDAKHNVRILNDINMHILYGLDGTKLHKVFSTLSLDTIIFQFPHSGSREPIKGQNPNYVLVHDFLSSSLSVLKKDGVVLITVVDSDYYDNMFKFEELAALTGFK